jgi:hypothetical protein
LLGLLLSELQWRRDPKTAETRNQDGHPESGSGR